MTVLQADVMRAGGWCVCASVCAGTGKYKADQGVGRLPMRMVASARMDAACRVR